ncbi:MAG: hypothetical protein D6743_10565 [Calditrichaeota bacterium]|nr:MAG: hypothetical protein D6743_10565 [Calditrichota bacterium]
MAERKRGDLHPRKQLVKKIVKRGLLISGILLLAGGAFFAVFILRFVPFVSAPDYPPPGDKVEAYLQDLDYLESLPRYDKSFSEGQRKTNFLDFVHNLESRIDATLSPGKFEMMVARAVAIADNAHTNVSPEDRSARVNHLPVRFTWFKEGLFVLQATSAYRDLLGAHLDSVGGVPIDVATKKLLPYFGGSIRRSRFYVPLTIASPQLLQAVGLSASADIAELDFSLRNGSRVKYRIRALPEGQRQQQPRGYEMYKYGNVREDSVAWYALKTNETPPLFLRNPQKPFDRHFLRAQNLLYLRINTCEDAGAWSLSKYLRTVIKEVETRHPKFAVVDLRFNNGGSQALSELSESLPALLPDKGKIFVITSAETFSYGIAAAVLFKYFGHGKVLIAGEPVGDRLRFWANGGTSFILPNSRVSLRVWSGLEDYADGCWDWTKCFWFSPMFRRRGVGDLKPDFPVQLSFADYANGQDSVMEAILATIH